MRDERAATKVDVKIGMRLRARRLTIGMSQERLAELLGVTFQQVQKYEKGVNRIAASRLLDIAVAVGMPIETFFEGLSPQLKTDDGANALERSMSTPEGVEMAALFSRIKGKSVRRRVLDLARAVAAPAD